LIPVNNILTKIDAKGILIIVPGSSWRLLNFVVVAVIFIGISHRMAHATSEVTSLICGTEHEHLPTRTGFLPIAEQSANSSEPSATRTDEEHIPLQQPRTTTRGIDMQATSVEDKGREGESFDGLSASEATHRTLRPEEEEPLRLEEGTWISNRRPADTMIDTDSRPSLSVRVSILAFIMWLLNVTWPDPPLPIP
jgi:hypothetical protein